MKAFLIINLFVVFFFSAFVKGEVTVSASPYGIGLATENLFDVGKKGFVAGEIIGINEFEPNLKCKGYLISVQVNEYIQGQISNSNIMKGLVINLVFLDELFNSNLGRSVVLALEEIPNKESQVANNCSVHLKNDESLAISYNIFLGSTGVIYLSDSLLNNKTRVTYQLCDSRRGFLFPGFYKEEYKAFSKEYNLVDYQGKECAVKAGMYSDLVHDINRLFYLVENSPFEGKIAPRKNIPNLNQLDLSNVIIKSNDNE